MKNKGLIILGVSIIVIGVILSAFSKEPIDWAKSYNENNTNPFDLKVFYEQLEPIFKDRKIVKIKRTFYEYEQAHKTLLSESNNIYINIDETYKPDPTSEKKLLNFIAKGNTAFISANSFSENLLDSLQVYTQTHLIQFLDTLQVNTINNTQPFVYKTKLKLHQTSFKDTLNIKALGKVTFTKNDSLVSKTNFIQVPYQKGVFYLHVQPEIFSNYHLLNIESPEYINQVLSLIPDKITNSNPGTKIYFESNFKTDSDLVNSPLRFIKKHKALNMAWNIILISVGLFLIINSKRKQRIIPIIPKVRNTSLDFVETISSLYEDSENFQPIIKQKINVFHKNIRGQYNVVTNKGNLKLAQQLSLKSGYDLIKTKDLIRFINTIQNRETSSITLLQKLDKEIQDFYKNTKAWKN